jgi:hypothetical protein
MHAAMAGLVGAEDYMGHRLGAADGGAPPRRVALSTSAVFDGFAARRESAVLQAGGGRAGLEAALGWRTAGWDTAFFAAHVRGNVWSQQRPPSAADTSCRRHQLPRGASQHSWVQ